MSRLPHYKRKKSGNDKSEALFAAYFDFGEEETAEEIPTVDPLKVILEACERWVSKGNQIERFGFGVSSRGLHRTSDDKGNVTVHSTAFYRACGERCCPLGAVLIDTESHFMPLLDVAKILQVDHFWVIGFVHGIDNQNIGTIGKNLEGLAKHNSYLEGKDAGRKVGAMFIKDRIAA